MPAAAAAEAATTGDVPAPRANQIERQAATDGKATVRRRKVPATAANRDRARDPMPNRAAAAPALRQDRLAIPPANLPATARDRRRIQLRPPPPARLPPYLPPYPPPYPQLRAVRQAPEQAAPEDGMPVRRPVTGAMRRTRRHRERPATAPDKPLDRPESRRRRVAPAWGEEPASSLRCEIEATSSSRAMVVRPEMRREARAEIRASSNPRR